MSARAATHLFARMSWPGSPRHLAAVRIVVGLFLTSVFSSGVIPLLLAIPAETYPGTRSAFPLSIELLAAQHLVQPLLAVGLVSSTLLALGLLTRAAAWVTLAAYLVTQNFYYRMLTAHDDWLYFTPYLLILALSSCSDVWSIDSLIRKRAIRPLQEYRWPVELMGAWLALAYVAAGLAKLFPLRKGVAWLNGYSLQGMVTNEILDSPIYWLLDRTLFDYRIHAPFVLLGAAGALIELSAVLVLFYRGAAKWVALAIIGLHCGIGLFGITGFLTIFLIAVIAWLDPGLFERRRSGARVAEGDHLVDAGAAQHQHEQAIEADGVSGAGR
jgi:hypothetical protein